MFFKISNNTIEHAFPFSQTKRLNDFYVALDSGWAQHENVLYKGYCTDQPLEQKVLGKDFTEQSGNYVILDFTEKCSVHYDNSRSFPMCHDDNTVTNHKDTAMTDVWFDGTVQYENGKWQFVHRPENVIKHPGHFRHLNKTQLVDLYCDYLIKCCNGLETDLPFFCADSNGGVDSLVIKSAFDYCSKDYKMVVGNNSEQMKSLGWGYKLIFVTDIPHIQLTGFCGDELLLRNPLYVQWLLDPYNIDLADEFDKYDYSFMKGFYNKNYRDKCKKNIGKFSKFSEAYEHTANVAVNDFQMWHAGETITFTPFRNINMALECFRADPDTMLDQVIHAGVSKEIIKRLNAKNLDYISKHKNNVVGD